MPHDEKTKTVVLEPYLTEQWYLNVTPLAEQARSRPWKRARTKFVPENWANVYFNWLRNIQPWCISRQLWWGHQIPVWYGPMQAIGCIWTSKLGILRVEHQDEADELRQEVLRRPCDR